MSLYAFCSSRITKDIKNALSAQGVTVIEIPDSPFLPYPVASHADMLCFYNRKDTVIIEKETLEKIIFPIKGIKVITDRFTHDSINEYPSDIRFNAALFEGFLFCREKYISPAILENVKAKIVDVKQGYAACSVCRVNSYSFITSDISLKKAGDKCGLDVLLIKPGHIGIDCYDYGFIGGASGLYQNKLFFTGDISLHPDYDKIHKFIHNRGVEEIKLSDSPLFDYGGILFVQK